MCERSLAMLPSRESGKLPRITNRNKMEGCDDSEFRESHQDCAGISLFYRAGSNAKSGLGYLSGLTFFLSQCGDFSVGGCCACASRALRANVRAQGSRSRHSAGDATTLAKSMAGRSAQPYSRIYPESISGVALRERPGIAGACAESFGRKVA